MKNNFLIASIVIAIGIIGAAFVLTREDQTGEAGAGNNVSMENGVQVIEIRAKGGYTPRKTIAKAGIPTVLRMNTVGTFDCSSFVRIPSLKISKSLASSGSTDIDLGTPASGNLRGTCAMGMYPFEIDFKN